MSVAVIIPCGPGRVPERDFALEVLLDYYRTCFPSVLVKLATSDGEPPPHGAARNEAVAGLPDGIDMLVFNDADSFCSPLQVAVAVGMADDEPGLVAAFTGYRRLSQAYSASVRSWRDAIDPPAAAVEWGMEASESHACVAVRRECFEAVGGYDPRFVGPLYLDIAANVMFGAHWPIRRVAGDAYHLWHPRDEGRWPDCEQANTLLNEEYARRRGNRVDLLALREAA